MCTVWIDKEIGDGKKRGKDVGEQVAKPPRTIILVGEGGKEGAKNQPCNGDGYGEDIFQQVQPLCPYLDILLFEGEQQDAKEGKPQPNIRLCGKIEQPSGPMGIPIRFCINKAK